MRGGAVIAGSLQLRAKRGRKRGNDAAIQKVLTLRYWIATPLARLAMTGQLISPADAITRHYRQLWKAQ